MVNVNGQIYVNVKLDLMDKIVKRSLKQTVKNKTIVMVMVNVNGQINVCVKRILVDKHVKIMICLVKIIVKVVINLLT